MSSINDFGMPFTSEQGDRAYSALDFRTYFQSLVSNGVVGGLGNELKVNPQATPNKTVYVDTGTIFISGALRQMTGVTNLSLADNTSGNPRIDRIVARLDDTNRLIAFVVRQGTPAAIPVPPALIRTDTFYELSLARITLANGYSAISLGDVTDERNDSTVCGYFTYRAKSDAFNWKLIQSYSSAGTFTWTAPDLFNGQPYQIGVWMCGGGGSGGAIRIISSNTYHGAATGGGSGRSRTLFLAVTPGNTYSVSVGAGGTSVTLTGLTQTSANGVAGGSTSFNGVTVLGGKGGNAACSTSTRYVAGADGAQGSDARTSNSPINDAPACGVTTLSVFSGSNLAFGGRSAIGECFNPFNQTLYLAAGGGTGGFTYPPSGDYQNAVAMPGGGISGGSSAVVINGAENQSSIGGTSSSPGCGGGAAGTYATNGASLSTVSGAGSGGCVFIYAQKGN
jgi:hypothetical protein